MPKKPQRKTVARRAPHKPVANTKAQMRRASPGNALAAMVNFPVGSPIWSSLAQSKINYVRHYRGWVYVAVRAIAEKIAQLRPRLGIQRRFSPEKSFLTKSMRERLKATTTLRESEDIEPLDEEHPLNELLDNPNDPDTSWTLWFQTMMFWELCGKAFWWLPRNNMGLPAEIWVIPTHWVVPIGGKERMIDKYRVQPIEAVVGSFEIDADDMICFRNPSPVSIVDGWSVLDGASAWVDQADSIDSARWNEMKNAHNAGLILALKPELNNPTAEDLNRAYAMLKDRIGGMGKNRLPLILPPGWESQGRFGMTAEELDYSTSFDQVRDTVLAAYRVPKGIVGIEPGVSNTSAYAPNAIFFDQCINPKLHYLAPTLTEKLAHRYDPKIRIYWENAAPLDPLFEKQKYDTALEKGAINANEYRQFMGLPPTEGGDERLIPSSMVPIPTLETGLSPILDYFNGGSDQGDEPKQIEMNKPGEEPEKEPEKEEKKPVYPAKSITKDAIPDGAIKVRLPNVRQSNDYSCGAAAFEAIARMYGVGPEKESWYANQLNTSTETGTEPQAIRDLADSLGLLTIARQGMTADGLKKYLDQGTPVIMLIQAWGSPETQAEENEDGHYVVAIGYTDHELIVEDPALRLTRGFLAWEDLDRRWHSYGDGSQIYDHWGMAVTLQEQMEPVKGKAQTNGHGKHLPKTYQLQTGGK